MRPNHVASTALLAVLFACTSPAPVPELNRVAALAEELDFATGDVSPDGRYLSEIDWETGDLQLVDLGSGEAEGLTGEGYGDGGYAWTSAFSHDGRRIAVAWYRSAEGRHELRVVDTDGSGLRVLLPARETLRYVDPLDWSPDGDQVLVALGAEDRTWRLGLVSVDDGPLRLLKTFGWLAPGGEQTYPSARFSPDGQYVAYDYRPDLEAYRRDIYALDLAEGTEVELVASDAIDRLVGWLPDGRGILFYSDRGGGPAVWRLRVRDGRPSGEPVRVRAVPPGMVPLGRTDGGYAFGRAAATTQIHVGTLDPDAGRVIVVPRPVADPPGRTSLAADWAPDGSRLVHMAFDPLPAGTESLVVRTPGGETVRDARLPATLHTSTGTLDWVSDSLIVMFGSVKGEFGVQALDPRDGTFTTLPVAGDGLRGGNLKWVETGPDGRTVYGFRSADGGSERELVAVDAGTGAVRVLGRYDADFRSLAVSPDGRELAIVVRDRDEGSTRLQVVPASGAGGGRVLARRGSAGITTPVAWTPDGDRLVFGQRVGSGRALWSVAADGSGDPLQIGGEAWCCRGHDLRFHPDGRRIAVPAGEPRGEVWMLRLETDAP